MKPFSMLILLNVVDLLRSPFGLVVMVVSLLAVPCWSRNLLRRSIGGSFPLRRNAYKYRLAASITRRYELYPSWLFLMVSLGAAP